MAFVGVSPMVTVNNQIYTENCNLTWLLLQTNGLHLAVLLKERYVSNKRRKSELGSQSTREVRMLLVMVIFAITTHYKQCSQMTVLSLALKLILLFRRNACGAGECDCEPNRDDQISAQVTLNHYRLFD